MDHIKFDYHSYKLPNLYFRMSKGVQPKPETHIHAKLEPVIMAVAKKYPHWKVIAVGYASWGDDVSWAQKFVVTHNDEIIGHIYRTYHGNREVIGLNNDRIESSLSRGEEIRTGDTNKAQKVIAKTFGKKTIQERMQDSADKTIRLTRGHVGSLLHSTESAMVSALGYVADEVFANWENTFAAVARQSGMSEKDIAGVPELVVKDKFYQEFKKCLQSDLGAAVLIHGNEYIVSKCQKVNTTLKRFTSETLPAPLKLAIGMLKLAPKHEAVVGAGYRSSEDSFYIMVEDSVWMSA
jgi:hypothetical protein